MTDVIRTGRLTDKAIVALFKALEDKFGYKDGYLRMNTVSLSYKGEEAEKLFNKRGKTSYAVTSGRYISTDYKFTINYVRGINTNVGRMSSAYFDEITINIGSQNNQGQVQPSPEDLVLCYDIIGKHTVQVTIPTVEEEAQGAVQLLQAQMSALSTMYQDMIVNLDERRADLEAERAAKLKEVEDYGRQKLEEIDSYQKKKQDEINKSQEALDKRAKELDDRDHQHVRRDLRANINQDIKDRLGKTLVPKQAAWIRIMIFVFSIIGSIYLGIVSYNGFQDFSNLLNPVVSEFDQAGNAIERTASNISDAKLWALFIKSLLSSIGAVGFLVYALSWLRRLYYDDVNMERELERYAYDINRASWAIETMMDIRKDKGEMPAQTWIEAVCNNLFSSERIDGRSHREVSPLEILLSSSAKAEFGPDGPKFEVGRTGAKKLAKEISEEK